MPPLPGLRQTATAIAGTWPRSMAWRFALYLSLSTLDWFAMPWGSLGCGLILALLYRKNRLKFHRFLKDLGSLWLLVLFPAILGLLEILPAGLPLAAVNQDILIQAVWRSLCLLVLFQGTWWFTSCTSMEEIRSLGLRLFGFLGPRAAAVLGTTLSMTLAFIPWIQRESRLAAEAVRLRQPSRSRIRSLHYFGTPLLLRLFAKVRQTADAMELRNATTLADSSIISPPGPAPAALPRCPCSPGQSGGTGQPFPGTGPELPDQTAWRDPRP